MTIELQVFYWIKYLFLFSYLLQILENLFIQISINKIGKNIIVSLAGYKNVLILISQVICVILLFFTQNPFLFMSLFLLSFIYFSHWSGSFNGGADSMSNLVLIALTFGSFFLDHEKALQSVLYYLAVIVCFSYFLSGWVKIKNVQWRNGVALSQFLRSKKYDVPPFWSKLSNHHQLCLVLSWLVLLFEVLFPLSVLNVNSVIFFCVLGLIFHLFNFILFGINRFVWSWIPTYPTLFYLSDHVFK